MILTLLAGTVVAEMDGTMELVAMKTENPKEKKKKKDLCEAVIMHLKKRQGKKAMS